MKILAIDQSLTGTGFCWLTITGSGQIVRSTDVAAPAPELRGGERLSWFRHWLLEELAGHPDVIVIEDAAPHGVPGSVKVLCELLGVLKCTIAEWRRTRPEVRLLIVNGMHLKMFACGKGNAKKEQIVLAAEKAFPGIVRESHNAGDEADALWLVEIGRYISLNVSGENEPRRNALTKIVALNQDNPAKASRRTTSRKPAIKEAA